MSQNLPSENLSHEEIAQRFVDSKAFDFQSMGKLIVELGPILAVRDKGLHGTIIGRYNTIACFLPASDVLRLIGNSRLAGLAETLSEETLGNISGK